MIDYKKCSRCGETKEAKDFYIQKGQNGNRLKSHCKECSKQSSINYQIKHKTWITNYRKNGEKQRQYSKDYYARTKDRQKKYRENFKSRHPDYAKKRYEMLREKLANDKLLKAKNKERSQQVTPHPRTEPDRVP